MKNKLTIFTPTYNRAELLKRLYNSLVEQSNKNFTWLIIDDGSKDNTKEVVEEFIKEKIIEIEYIKKENGGKHSAMDLAHEKCCTEFIAGVDSDDYLLENTIDNIYHIIENYMEEEYVGIVGRKFDTSLRPLDKGIFEEGKKIMFHDLALKYNYKADTFLIFRTSIVKNFKFPKFEGEKFVTEKVLYDQFMYDYPMVMMSTIDYIAEYQSEGYSASSINLMLNNPKGVLYAFKSDTYYMTKYKQGFKNIVIAWARYFAWRRITKLKNLFKDEMNIKSNTKIFGWFLSIIFYIRYKSKYKNYLKASKNL